MDGVVPEVSLGYFFVLRTTDTNLRSLDTYFAIDPVNHIGYVYGAQVCDVLYTQLRVTFVSLVATIRSCRSLTRN